MDRAILAMAAKAKTFGKQEVHPRCEKGDPILVTKLNLAYLDCG
jgi:hypothetical protein